MDKHAQLGTSFVERTEMPAPRDDRVLLVPSLAGAVGNLLEWYDFGLSACSRRSSRTYSFPIKQSVRGVVAIV